jgi:hypothetical protein
LTAPTIGYMAGRGLARTSNNARQQDALAAVVESSQLVVKTAVLEAIADVWTSAELRQTRRSHRIQIQLARSGLHLSREVPLPEELLSTAGGRPRLPIISDSSSPPGTRASTLAS